MSPPYEPTLVAWWYFGKERRDAEGVQLVPPYQISETLDQVVATYRESPATAWRWFRVDERLVVERPPPRAGLYDDQSRIYYLIDEGLAVVEGLRLAPPDDRWEWGVHLADIFHDEGRDCWLVKKLFVELRIDRTLRSQRLLQLADLAGALELGLVSPREATALLRRTDALAGRVAAGGFLTEAVQRAREACQRLGW